ncbi:acyl carrier protein [Marilutibacter chinensis]|uniref:Acyl carrier protein n=1 Tax=Marilutibacter chinensis TaxID=2912247 RepID=A0ABS9HW80_9GAMM|nr:acyl carrier protein [Lysobacter chinensis]MCF7222410.1 acyl carrier protein [Lysobacter chinensis]
MSRLVQEQYGIDAGLIVPEARLRDLGIDSMMSADLLIELETAFSITFTDLQLPSDPTVGDVLDLVHRTIDPQSA